MTAVEIARRVGETALQQLEGNDWVLIVHPPRGGYGIWYPELNSKKLGVKLICNTPEIPMNSKAWLCGPIGAEGSYAGAWANAPREAVKNFLAGNYPCGPNWKDR